jgi:hypothetical protein
MNRDDEAVTTIIAAQNLPALLALDFEEFVECAYLTILNRPADADGLGHFVERLRVGHPKIAILSALYGSEEARAANVRIPWMQGAILRHKLTRLPIIKLAFNRANHNAIILQFEHRIHVLERKVAVLSSQTAAQFMELDRLVGGVGLSAGPTNMDVSPTALEKDARKEMSDKSALAKRVYNALVEAISEEREDPNRSI